MLKLCLVPPSSPPPITLRAVDDTRGFFVIAPAARCLTVLFLHLKVIYSAWLVAFLVLLHCYIVQLSSALGSGHLTPAFTSFIEIVRMPAIKSVRTYHAFRMLDGTDPTCRIDAIRTQPIHVDARST